jgi:hypothetical protein
MPPHRHRLKVALLGALVGTALAVLALVITDLASASATAVAPCAGEQR